MQSLWQDSYLTNGDDYIETLYELYLKDPQKLPHEWRRYFDSLIKDMTTEEVSHDDIRQYFLTLARQKQISVAPSGETGKNSIHEKKQALVKELVYAYRALGHFQAKIDPLGLASNPAVPELSPDYYGLTEADMDETFLPDHFGDGQPKKLKKLLQELKSVYCASVGVEYMHVLNQKEVRWLQKRLEDPNTRPVFSKEKQKRIYDCLVAADGLEKYLGTKYVGQKRFSLEGGDSLIPLLDELVQRAGSEEVKEIVIGMAHRGRLNVLINILGKAPQELFNEFEGKYTDETYSGDVKYHNGFSSDVKTPAGPVHLALAFNPSHLEIVSPVVAGAVRARQHRRKSIKSILDVQIHGDASFAGQGVVMETFALSQTKGFGTGGTVHIIINNQVGFTTNPSDARSTFYCTDVAKMVQAPIFHVNGDDPEAVVWVTQMALDYRMTFGKDIVIDLVCYRRHGHNEADEPSATQPLMYQIIRKRPTLARLYADKLVKADRLSDSDASATALAYRDALDAGKNPVPPLLSVVPHPFNVDWTPYANGTLQTPVKTAVNTELLKQLADRLLKLPENMTLQPQVGRMLEEWHKMAAGELLLNWGYAETLAYATLLYEGHSIRLSGQDSERGTFAHRHAVLHDYQTGETYTPLAHITDTDKADFTVIDSILSEAAVVAFEYGYATASPNDLVLWEAQFGDFANGAQVVIDQFISAGEQKWKRFCGLVMLLPHGYEGMGPEHSSARLERYLQLCAQENMQVCYPTTPAQIFHLLRRQLLRPVRKPLIVMTPKSLLRHKLAVSSLSDLSQGEFNTVIPDTDTAIIKASDVERVVLCTGKVYYDLLEARKKLHIDNVPLIRLEELYPFPEERLLTVLAPYKKTKTLVWCQEEPQNQGAWPTLHPCLENIMRRGQSLHYAGREAAASPATGLAKLHLIQQERLIKQALQGNTQ